MCLWGHIADEVCACVCLCGVGGCCWCGFAGWRGKGWGKLVCGYMWCASVGVSMGSGSVAGAVAGACVRVSRTELRH